MFAGFLCFNTLFQDFARISPEVQHKFELEHIKTGDNHSSAFPRVLASTVICAESMQAQQE